MTRAPKLSLSGGYQAAPPAERRTLEILVAFAVTVAGARGITRYRQRAKPFRVLARVTGDSKHVHHFVPGIAITLGSATGGFVVENERARSVLALLLGVGAALTLDEVALLVQFRDRYWRGERAALGQGIAAGAGALGIAAHMVRRGRQTPPPVEGYCLRERKSVTISNPRQETTRRGQPAVRGSCPSCGATIFRLGTLR
jgi:hypothetical protein